MSQQERALLMGYLGTGVVTWTPGIRRDDLVSD